MLLLPCSACQPLSVVAPPYVKNDMRLMEQKDVPQSSSTSLTSLDALILEYVRDEQLCDVRASHSLPVCTSLLATQHMVA